MRIKWIQKTSTSFLLVLFVFIHAIKTFHTHDFTYASSSINKNATVVKTGFLCAICDFQIAKDSDTQSATFNISAPLHFINFYYNYTFFALCKLSVTSSVRGPPAFIV